MPFRTKSGSHYHMTEGCHGADIPCGTEGLEPCSDCCDASSMGGGSAPGAGSGTVGAGSGGAGGGSEEHGHGLASEDVPAEVASRFEPSGEAGSQGEPLDAYDSTSSAEHAEGLVQGGVSALAEGNSAPEPRYGIVPEAFAGMTDSVSSFDIEPLECPDRVPETWGSSAPYPEPLPSWDAPMRAPGEFWFYEMDAYAPSRVLSMQVAAAVAPAMDRWPGATAEMLKYGLAHGFMTAPASTAFHLNTPGGLACHSASVAAAAVEMMERPESEAIRRELGPDWKAITMTVALWHDACKMDYYEPLDQPKRRSDGNVAFYGVTKSRQNDPRHGELSADIVRKFYGKALPEVAYEAISMHMGPWDHRRMIPKWVTDALDDDLQARKAVDEAERRAKQDADVASGKLWWQLRRKVDDRKALAESIRGKSEFEAIDAIASSSDPHAKRMRILRGRMRALEDPDDPKADEYMGEMRRMIQDCSSADGADDTSVARRLLQDDRKHADATLESRKRRAARVKEESEEFARRMEQAWEEHPFIKLIHEADLVSSRAGR